MSSTQTHVGKLRAVARKIVALLARQPNLRQTEIASALGECDSTIMRALPIVESMGVRLSEDDKGRMSVAE